MGSPSGFAFRFSTPDESNPIPAAEVVAVLQNSLLVIAAIAASSFPQKYGV
jgi:hypothetical protein